MMILSNVWIYLQRVIFGPVKKKVEVIRKNLNVCECWMQIVLGNGGLRLRSSL